MIVEDMEKGLEPNLKRDAPLRQYKNSKAKVNSFENKWKLQHWESGKEEERQFHFVVD